MMDVSYYRTHIRKAPNKLFRFALVGLGFIVLTLCARSAFGGGGAAIDLGTVTINSFEIYNNDTSSEFDITFSFTQSGASTEPRFIGLTVTDASGSSSFACANVTLASNATTTFNPTSSELSQEAGSASNTTWQEIMTQPAGTYLVGIDLYAGGGAPCSQSGDENVADSASFTITAPSSGPDHYAISFTSGGTSFADITPATCSSIPVTVIAHDASHTPVTSSATVTLTTSTGSGDWIENSNNSTINITFDSTTETTYLRYPVASETATITVDGVSPPGTSPDEDPSLVASAVGLVMTGPGNIVSGLNVDNATTLAIAESCTTSGALATTFYYSCLDPTSCIEGQDLTINDESISNNGLSPTTVSLTYTSGSSTFDVNFEDVGQVQLFANVTVTASAAADASGSWDTNTTFVSKPATLSLSVSGNSGTTSSGSGFIPAGTDFTITVDAKNSDNANTPNFGQESTPVVPTLSWSWVYPVTASLDDSDLSRTTYSTNGIADGSGTITGNFPKVGTIAINAAIPGNDYLTAGDISNRPSLNVGRFYPNAFELTNNAGASPAVLDACSSGGFTYFDESAIDIDYKITAKNALGNAITNYDAGSGYNVASVSIGVESTADDGVNLATQLSGATSSWSSGVYSVDSSSSRFASSGSSPNAELLANIGVIITDSLDGLNLPSLDFDPATSGDCTGSCTGRILPSSLRLRHGRLRLAGASGPETAALPAPLETQYYNGSAWVRNTLDDCASFPELIQLGGSALTAGVTVDSGTSTASYTSLTSSTVTLVDGTSGLVFSAPGIGNTGSFQIDFNGLTGLNHLQSDWNGDGEEFPSPATITFGSFRGHDKIISWKVSGAN